MPLGQSKDEKEINLPKSMRGIGFYSSDSITLWDLKQILDCKLWQTQHQERQTSISMDNINEFKELVNTLNVYNNIVSIETSANASKDAAFAAIFYQQIPDQISPSILGKMYKSSIIYNTPEVRALIEERYSISFEEFTACLLIFSLHFQQAREEAPEDIERFLTAMDVPNAANLLKIFAPDKNKLQVLARNVRKVGFGEHSRSVISENPILQYKDGKVSAPIPQLIPSFAENLVVNLPNTPSTLFNDVGKQFEVYSINILRAAFPNLDFASEDNYGSKKHQRDTPDIRLYESGRLKGIIECKNQTLSFDKKFNRKTNTDFDVKSDKIAEGIVQIWRYVEHLHTENKLQEKLAENISCYVLTGEWWMAGSSKFHSHVFLAASKIADKESIHKTYRLDVAIVSSMELDNLAWTCTENEFLELPSICCKPENFEISPALLAKNYDFGKIRTLGDPYKDLLYSENEIISHIGDMERFMRKLLPKEIQKVPRIFARNPFE